MKKQYIKFIALVLLSLQVGCSNYLDVEPKSSMSEDMMFASEAGFEQALVGVYSQLGKQELYGDKLSLGFVSALAQNYSQVSTSAPYYATARYNYTSDEVQKSLLDIWTGGYNAIAGLNKILEKAETNRTVLSSTGYNLIRGEALALRAYIHFDLFRLFGPEYQVGKGQNAIPYRTSVDAFANKPSTSEEFCSFVLDDIKLATSLLKTVDPLVNNNTALDSRRIKLNYYAAKGLEARVQLYIGQKDAAVLAANEVVNASRFPFVNIVNVNAGAASKDRLFISELVFALRSRDILKWTENYFKFYRSQSMGLTRTAANFNTIYESSTTDIRKKYLFEQDQSVTYPSKFWQTYVPGTDEGLTSAARKDQLVPMIRLSEMYYILAEAAATPQEGIVLLNKVRTARAVDKLPEGQSTTSTFLQAEIQKEYHKEFYGEGQYFFYLKRKNIRRMPFMTTDVPLTIYKLPIPDVELEYNPTY